MSNLKTKRVQIGDHSTATNNFVMHQSDTPDGKVHISNGTLDSHTSKMTLAHDGKLGVGTTSPTSGLDIQTDTNPVMKVSRGTNNSANINLYYNTTFTGQVSAAASGFQLSSVGSSTPMQFYTNGSKNMEIDPSGRVTTPNQPSFLAHTMTGFNSSSNIMKNFVTMQHNTGGHFNNSTGYFTAPVAGKYLVNSGVLVAIGSGRLEFNVQVNSGSPYLAGNGTGTTYDGPTLSGVFNLSANDTIRVILVSGSPHSNGNHPNTYFGVTLIG